MLNVHLLQSTRLVLFDGHCHLCNGTVDQLIRWDRRKRLRYTPLQGEVGQALVTGRGAEGLPDSVLFWDGSTLHAEMEAVFAIAGVLGFPFTAVRVLGLLPRGWRNGLYRVVARNRTRWFGRSESCRMLPPELQEAGMRETGPQDA